MSRDLDFLPPENKKYEVVLLAVAHDEFKILDINKLKTESAVVFDAKAVLARDLVDARL